MQFTGEGNDKPLQYSGLENSMNSMKRQKRYGIERLILQVSRYQICYWRRVEKELQNEETEPKGKKCPGVDVTGDGNKVQYWKEQYCIGTWNVTSMNQGKLEVVKQDVANGKS